MKDAKRINYLKAVLLLCYTAEWVLVGFIYGCLYSIWCLE